MIHVRRALLLWALLLSNFLVIWSPDVLPASLFAWTVLREGNVDYDEFTFLDRDAYFFRACGESTVERERPAGAELTQTRERDRGREAAPATVPPRSARATGGPPAPGPRDHVCSIFPPGAALLALPAFAPFALAAHTPEDLPLLLGVGKVVAAAWEALAAVLLVAAAQRLTRDRGWAMLLGLLYLLGTSVRTISSQALWQHGAAHLLFAFALLVLVRLFAAEPVRSRALFGAGLALGFAIVVRQTSAVFAVGAIAALLLARRPAQVLVAGVIVGALPLFAYDLAAFGNPLEQGYGAKPFETPLLTGLYGLLLSPSRGLLLYSPFLAFAGPTFVRAWHARDDAFAPLWRAFGVAALGLLVGYALYTEWWGGRVFGARFLSDAFPVLVLALAAARLSIGWRRAFAASAAWALLLHNAAALVYDQRWDTEPISVNFDPSRLFSWSDPQWLAYLREAIVRPSPREGAAILLSALVLAVLLYLERPRARGGTLAT